LNLIKLLYLQLLIKSTNSVIMLATKCYKPVR